VLLRTKELLDAADTDKLRPRWDGPFAITACPRPNTYTLALPPRMRCSSTVNVDRLKPFHERVGALQAPGPVSDGGQEGEHEVELLLNRKTTKREVTRYLARWRGHTSADDAWLRVEELGHGLEQVAEYDAAAPRRRGDWGARAAAAIPVEGEAALTPPMAPDGFRLAAVEALTGKELVGRSILYRWPGHGWVRGRVVRISRAARFSHGVRYARGSAVGVGDMLWLLDVPSHGCGPLGRWMMLCPA
jgi:hypothetical protein